MCEFHSVCLPVYGGVVVLVGGGGEGGGDGGADLDKAGGVQGELVVVVVYARGVLGEAAQLSETAQGLRRGGEGGIW